jgi:hypothetical protein
MTYISNDVQEYCILKGYEMQPLTWVQEKTVFWKTLGSKNDNATEQIWILRHLA